MSDPFLESVNSPPTKDGPFRTPEPTPERRLERARGESFERVERATRRAMIAEGERERRAQRLLYGLLGLSCAALVGVFVMGALGSRGWFAWLCPAIAALISVAFVTWKNRALHRAWAGGGVDEPEVEDADHGAS